MAEIYILNIPSCKNVLLSLKESLSDERKKRIEKLKNQDAVLQNIASEVLLCYCLKAKLPLVCKRDQNGKPYIPTLPFFNISHSQDFIVCAVSNKQVGVDIEKISRMKISLLRSILSPRELDALQTVSGAALQYALCEKWVRKESYLKMTGQGLRRKITSLTFSASGELEGEEIFSRVFDLSNGYLVSFCRKDFVDVSVCNVTCDDLCRYFGTEN